MEVSIPRGPERPRILVIHNHAASWRRFERFSTVLGALATAGCEIVVRRTEAAGDPMRLARAADRQTFDLIAVAGGDGTINDAVNGLHAGSPPFGLIPLGTANVLAHEIGLGTEPEQVVSCLLAPRRLEVRPGVVNGRRFMMMAGIGFDAHAVRAIPKPVKRRLGKIAYFREMLRQLAVYRFPVMEVRVDGQRYDTSTLIVARGRLYGGRFVLAPDADLAVPRLHAALLLRNDARAMAASLAALAAGRLQHSAMVRIIPAQRIEVVGPAGDPIQGDGDIIAGLPAVIGLAEEAVRLAVPPEHPAPSAA